MSKARQPHPSADQVAVVTGAAGGLGTALCDALSVRGYTVVGVDLAGADRVLDVRDADACRELAQEVQPHLWVNNAGILASGSALTQPDAEIRRCIDVNLLGVINGTRAAAEVMVPRQSGRILNVSSLAGWVAVPGETVYAATKHAVRAFSVGMAAELRGTGVRMAILCPDGIWTPMLEERLSDPSIAMSFTGKRLLTAEEVAAAAMKLIDSNRILASVPPSRGLQTRLLGIAPRFSLAAGPVFAKIGRRNQRKFMKTQGG